MAAVASLPFYSTSYGETYGYNERDGSNTSNFRNRYLNQSYRGTAELGPVRFNATRAAAEQDLPHINVARPPTATAQLQRTQHSQQPMQVPASLQQTARGYGGESEAYAQRAAAASLSQPHFSRSQGLDTFQPQQTGSSYPQQRLEQPFEPRQSLQQARLAQSQAFGDSIGARYALPATNSAPSVNASPYYVPPYEAPPSSSFAPAARALGNKTYQFETDNPDTYAFTASFRGAAPRSNKPQQDPGQSIPFGRLQAEDAREVRHKMSMSSWDSFHIPSSREREEEGASARYNLEGLQAQRKVGVDPENYCKWSMSRRLPVGDNMRYHTPGYCGFVPTERLRFGGTYGKITRLSLAGNPEGL